MKRINLVIIFILYLAIHTSNIVVGQTRKFEVDFNKKIKLHIETSDFDSLKHKITRTSINGWSAVYQIDGQLVFGTDWGIPDTKLDKMILTIGNDKIKLDVSTMYNPWIGNYCNAHYFELKPIEGGYLLIANFSDGAASYITEWKIIKDKSVRTMISVDEGIISRFLSGNNKDKKQAEFKGLK